MRTRILAAAAFLVCVLVVSTPLFAHHGSAAFDTTKKVTVKGIVTEWRWANPHCYIRLDAKDDQGNIVHWVGEAENPAFLVSRGWSPRDVKVGDEVTMVLIVAKNGVPIGRVQTVTFADGRTLPSSGADAPAKGGDAPPAATEK
jgi:hypothetical protein